MTITRVKWQGRQYVVESNENGIVKITHNGFPVRRASRERVVTAFHRQLETSNATPPTN
jgi:hypothetical protein